MKIVGLREHRALGNQEISEGEIFFDLAIIKN
jgi:hypothetical protein